MAAVISVFLKKECDNNSQFRGRFLALGAGTVFKPSPSTYTDRVIDIIDDAMGRYDYVEWDSISDVSNGIYQILDEADEAIRDKQWDVAFAILAGLANAGNDILECGDDSDGELSSVVDECLQKLQEFARLELPEKIRHKLFDMTIADFKAGALKESDWWWNWLDIAIEVTDTPEQEESVLNVLEHVATCGTSSMEYKTAYDARQAQNYILKLLSKCGTEEQQVKYMYDHVENPHIRHKLLQRSWDNEDYKEVLRLAIEGENHDAEVARLVAEWRQWQLKVYGHEGDRENTIRLARFFFFQYAGYDKKEFSMEAMYDLLKSLIPDNDWNTFVEELVADTIKERMANQRLFIFTREKMWDRYMEYLRQNPSTIALDNAPKELLKIYKDECVSLYAECVRELFMHANNRSTYRDGVSRLRKLRKIGGSKEVEAIVMEQKNRRPKRPALIEELSRL